MAGLCSLVVVQTVLAARSGNALGVLSLAIASVVAMSVMTRVAGQQGGVDIAGHPRLFALVLMIMVGFPLGVLAVSGSFMSTAGALVWGGIGVAYMPLALWVSVRLGLTGYMIDALDPRLQLGHLAGLETSGLGVVADVLGMSISAGVTLAILSLPALPLVLICRHLIGRS